MTAMETRIACPECGTHCHKRRPFYIQTPEGGCPIHGYVHICQCEFCEGRGTVTATFSRDLGW